MSFEQDMLDMSPEQVGHEVQARLSGRAGVFAVASRDEPVWAILQSAFYYWRENANKRNAVDAALDKLVLPAFEQMDWSTARLACEFALALVTGSPPWVPPSSRAWPYRQWLQVPTYPPEKTEAAIAAMRLHVALEGIHSDLIEPKFKEALNPGAAANLYGQRWFEECWKSFLQIRHANNSASPWRMPLFPAFAFARRCEEPMRYRLLQSIIAWAWLVTDSAGRAYLNDAMVKAARDFEDADFREEVLHIAQQEFGADYRQTPVAQPAEESALNWLRRPIALHATASEHRRSELCPA